MRDAIPALHPHEQLLLACASAWEDGRARQAVEAALSAPELDWPAAVRAGIQQGLAQSLAGRLRAFPDDPRIPRDVSACLERIYRATAARNRVIFRETGRVARALEAAGIPFLVLKGVGLALTVYPDPALRSFADIDILVGPADIARAGAAAATCGFLHDREELAPVEYHLNCVARLKEDILTDTLAPEYDSTHTGPHIVAASHALKLEIHRTLFPQASGLPRCVEMAPFWESPQCVRLPDGTPIRLPGPEAMLAHLAAHAGRHAYTRLLFPLDIAWILKTQGAQIDWKRLAYLADRFAARSDLARLLDFAQAHLGAAIPAAALRQLQSGCRARPLAPADIFTAMHLEMQERGFQKGMRLLREQTMRERLVSIVHILFPAPATMRLYYGARSPLRLGIFYLLRPFQLAGRLARVGWRAMRARRDPQARYAGRANRPHAENSAAVSDLSRRA